MCLTNREKNCCIICKYVLFTHISKYNYHVHQTAFAGMMIFFFKFAQKNKLMTMHFESSSFVEKMCSNTILVFKRMLKITSAPTVNELIKINRAQLLYSWVLYKNSSSFFDVEQKKNVLTWQKNAVVFLNLTYLSSEIPFYIFGSPFREANTCRGVYLSNLHLLIRYKLI